VFGFNGIGLVLIRFYYCVIVWLCDCVIHVCALRCVTRGVLAIAPVRCAAMMPPIDDLSLVALGAVGATAEPKPPDDVYDPSKDPNMQAIDVKGVSIWTLHKDEHKYRNDLYINIQERLGQHLSVVEMLALVDVIYLEDGDATIALVDERDRWTSKRHPLNSRGDEDSEQQREDGVDKVGILDIRKGPWYIDAAADSDDAAMEANILLLHWGNLLAGARRSYVKDKKRENKAVQLSVRAGVKHSKRYSRQTPNDVLMFLVDTGNITNDSNTPTTFIEHYRATRGHEQAWSKKKIAMGWNTNNMSGKEHDLRKHAFIEGLCPGVYPKYLVYEKTNTFFKLSQKVFSSPQLGAQRCS
jgi:hypothetical protein